MHLPSFKKNLNILALAILISGLFVHQIVLAAVGKQWPSSGTPDDIAVATADRSAEDNQHITQASDGDYIITYRLAGDIYVQKFSGTNGDIVSGWNGGSPLNVASGAPSAIVADSSGGAYIAWHENFGGGNCDVMLQRVNSSGSTVFTRDLIVTTGSGCEVFMDMIPDGSGGVYIVWGNGSSFTEFGTDDLYMTRVTSLGVVDLSWNTGGSGILRPLLLPETVASTSHEHSAQIADDGLGNVFAMYESSDLSFYLAATKISSAGVVAGTPWDTPLEIDGDNNGNRGRHLVSDGAGNAYIAFLSGSFGSPDKIEAQKINSAGALQWGTGLVVTSTDVDSFSGQPRAAYDGSGGLIVGWQTGGSPFDVYAHHVTSAGVLDTADDWASAPIAVSDDTDGNVDWFNTLDRSTMQPDGAGGAYFLFQSFDGGSFAANKLQHINSDGSKEFVGDGLIPATGAGIEAIQGVMVSDGSTGVVTLFQDEEDITGFDIYMQYFDEVVAAGGGGSSRGRRAFSCDSPPKPRLPSPLETIEIDGDPAVYLQWSLNGGKAKDLSVDILRNGQKIDSVAGSTTSFIDDGVSANTCNPDVRGGCKIKNYNYQIRVINSCGNQAVSDVSKASINPVVPEGVPVDVWADITVDVKDGFNQLFDKKLKELIELGAPTGLTPRSFGDAKILDGLTLKDLRSAVHQSARERLLKMGNKTLVEDFFKNSGHATNMVFSLRDQVGNIISGPTDLRTNIFGEIRELYLGQLIAGESYTIELKLKNQRYVLPKIFNISIHNAQPISRVDGLHFEERLFLGFDRHFCFGDFQEDGDIDLMDMFALKQIIDEEDKMNIHELDEINIDGIAGFNLEDFIAMLKNFTCRPQDNSVFWN